MGAFCACKNSALWERISHVTAGKFLRVPPKQIALLMFGGEVFRRFQN